MAASPLYRCDRETLRLAEEAERIARDLRRIAESPCPKSMLERAEADCASLRTLASDTRMAFRGEMAKVRRAERDALRSGSAEPIRREQTPRGYIADGLCAMARAHAGAAS